MFKKISIFSIFISSMIVSLSLFNTERSIAQSDYQKFLEYVYKTSVNTCQPYGTQCGDCAKDLAYGIIKKNRITNKRRKKDIYRAARRACN